MSQKRLHEFNRARLAAGKSVVIVTDYHCARLGEFERSVACNCPGKTVPAFECSRHVLCSVQRRSTDPAVAFCGTCPDFEPITQTA